jgi:serine/threonine-protein kinase
LIPGSLFGNYRVKRLVAQGGMGAVYLATDVQSQRAVALKLVRADAASDPEYRARFEREARLTAEVDHPHVVPLYEAGQVDGVLYSATRFIDGTDLGALIAYRRTLHPRWATLVVAQIASALDSAHERRLIHRDVKPANILIEDRGGEAFAYLTDFGLSKHVDAGRGLTRPGLWVGTFSYAAPEQIEARDIGPATDVYALGCVLHEMLTGMVPYERVRTLVKPPTSVELAARLTDQIPRSLSAVVERATAIDPKQRYESAGDLARAALDAVRDAEPAPQEPLLPIARRVASAVLDRSAPTTA